jgi:hypothetical protein
METDLDYFSRRASDERAAAERASLAEVRSVHTELAHRYRDLAVGLKAPVMPRGDPE